jgi:hypothetical protein
MSFSCPFECCDCSDDSGTSPLPKIRGFRRECQATEHYNIFCELCQTGTGFTRKAANIHEDGYKHRELYKTEKIANKKQIAEETAVKQNRLQMRNVLREIFCRDVLNESEEIVKFRSSCDIFMKIIDTKILVFKPWAVEAKGAIFDWEHDLVGLSELKKVCRSVAFKEILSIVQQGFVNTRLSHDSTLLNRKAEISRLLATDGHVIMNRIHQFIGKDFPWLWRCFRGLV